MKTYAEKLKDPRWQRKRLEIMERDGFACHACGELTKPLNIHHCYYIPKTAPWDYPSESLVSLCENCHNEITFRLPHVLQQLKTPDDVCRWSSLMTLIGSSESQSFTMATKAAFAMDTLKTATTKTGQLAAVKVLQILRSEIDKITKTILES